MIYKDYILIDDVILPVMENQNGNVICITEKVVSNHWCYYIDTKIYLP